ncbi:MAG: HlyD family efflux transporter periplasmic adaptor subunit, partial [Pseudomonadota bacterium]
AALIVAALAWAMLTQDRQGPPEGFVQGNGRLEAEQIDISPKTPGRVEEVLAREGDLIASGDLLARMDTTELEAALDRARAEAALSRQGLAEAEAVVVQRRSELRLAELELERARMLHANGRIPETLLDQRQTTRDVADAVLGASAARVETERSRIAAAEAEARRLEAQVADSALHAPAAGRVLYRLAQPGEVVAAGDPVLTLLSLDDVYMEVFLPAGDAGLLPLGAEARIVLDVLPDYAVPAEVSFVSPEAQFTPKQVETLDERETLVFRVRVRIPPDLVRERIAHVKTGMRGIAVIRVDGEPAWPEALQRRMPDELFE